MFDLRAYKHVAGPVLDKMKEMNEVIRALEKHNEALKIVNEEQKRGIRETYQGLMAIINGYDETSTADVQKTLLRLL